MFPNFSTSFSRNLERLRTKIARQCKDSDDDGGDDHDDDDLGDQDIDEEEGEQHWAEEPPADQPIGAQLGTQHEVDVPDGEDDDHGEDGK